MHTMHVVTFIHGAHYKVKQKNHMLLYGKGKGKGAVKCESKK